MFYKFSGIIVSTNGVCQFLQVCVRRRPSCSVVQISSSNPGSGSTLFGVGKNLHQERFTFKGKVSIEQVQNTLSLTTAFFA